MSLLVNGFVAVFIFTTIVSAVLSCRQPPSLWCSSPEISRECKVEEQCRNWNKASITPVQFTLYLESLCPDCKQFVTQQLYPTWLKERQDGGKWVFDCQHGAEECYGNVVETCAIHLLKNIKVYFPFIHCIEDSSESTGIEALVKKCAVAHQIDYEPLLKCANSSMGNQLEHEMALKTDALNPPHSYVPWVTLYGVHTEDLQKKAQSNLLELICDSYKGPKPQACTAHVLNRSPRPQIGVFSHLK